MEFATKVQLLRQTRTFAIRGKTGGKPWKAAFASE
jgi:hypothetical protein